MRIINAIKNCIRIAKNIDDMVILRVDGGLGSVILQYALGVNINKSTGKKIKYDATWFEGDRLTCDGKNTQEFTIKKLFPNIDFDIATKEEIKFYKRNYSYKNKKIFQYQDILLKNKEPKYFAGYYSHYKYWYNVEDILQENLDFSSWQFNEENQNMIEKIKGCENSVAIHIRRGDYLALNWCCLEKEYYINAIKYLQDKLGTELNLFFFSNDIEYVKSEILPCVDKIDYTLVDINDHYHGYNDLYLMSLCKHQIIANSSFSVCAAILNKNKNKYVIAPHSVGFCFPKGVDTSGMEESMQNPNWVILDYESGELVREKLTK